MLEEDPRIVLVTRSYSNPKLIGKWEEMGQKLDQVTLSQRGKVAGSCRRTPARRSAACGAWWCHAGEAITLFISALGIPDILAA